LRLINSNKSSYCVSQLSFITRSYAFTDFAAERKKMKGNQSTEEGVPDAQKQYQEYLDRQKRADDERDRQLDSQYQQQRKPQQQPVQQQQQQQFQSRQSNTRQFGNRNFQQQQTQQQQQRQPLQRHTPKATLADIDDAFNQILKVVEVPQNATQSRNSTAANQGRQSFTPKFTPSIKPKLEDFEPAQQQQENVDRRSTFADYAAEKKQQKSTQQANQTKSSGDGVPDAQQQYQEYLERQKRADEERDRQLDAKDKEQRRQVPQQQKQTQQQVQQVQQQQSQLKDNVRSSHSKYQQKGKHKYGKQQQQEEYEYEEEEQIEEKEENTTLDDIEIDNLTKLRLENDEERMAKAAAFYESGGAEEQEDQTLDVSHSNDQKQKRGIQRLPPHKFARFVPSESMKKAELMNSDGRYVDNIRPVNSLIPRHVDTVKCIDSTTREDHGVMSKVDALNLAKEKGLDLVLVSQLDEFTGVCKLMNYAEYLEERCSKDEVRKDQEKETVSKHKIKKIRMRGKTEVAALKQKVDQTVDFLEEGKSVQVSIMSRDPKDGEVMLTKIKKLLDEKFDASNIVMDPLSISSDQVLTTFKLRTKKK
jgi:translation initiation factor IF-3